MAVPSRLKPHFLAEDPRAQFVFLAEVYKPDARAFQPLDQLYHIALSLVLHCHHAYEYLSMLIMRREKAVTFQVEHRENIPAHTSEFLTFQRVSSQSVLGPCLFQI